MATRKKKVTGKAVSKAKSTALASIQEQIKKEASVADKTVGAVLGNRIRTNGKEFKLPDGSTHKGPLRAVIIDYSAQNHYYEGSYDPDNIVPPACYAITAPASLGYDIDDMVPSDKAKVKMHTDCALCPMNQFGTDERGKGKACKNTRQLVVAMPDDDPESQLMLIGASPKATKGFDSFVKKLAGGGATPITVITEVDFESASAQPVLTFKAVEPNPNIHVHWSRRHEAQGLLKQEFDYSGSETKASASRTKKKKTAKKRSTRRAA
jgi:hypothetical protein